MVEDAHGVIHQKKSEVTAKMWDMSIFNTSRCEKLKG
jgi:hypothetical protein